MDWAPLARLIAAELEALARATEELAEGICADQEVARRCLPMLQQFDHLAQHQAELARLIARLGQGTAVPQALSSVRLAALADRLGNAR